MANAELLPNGECRQNLMGILACYNEQSRLPRWVHVSLTLTRLGKAIGHERDLIMPLHIVGRRIHFKCIMISCRMRQLQALYNKLAVWRIQNAREPSRNSKFR
jgi:hypothetical protein